MTTRRVALPGGRRGRSRHAVWRRATTSCRYQSAVKGWSVETPATPPSMGVPSPAPSGPEGSAGGGSSASVSLVATVWGSSACVRTFGSGFGLASVFGGLSSGWGSGALGLGFGGSTRRAAGAGAVFAAGAAARLTLMTGPSGARTSLRMENARPTATMITCRSAESPTADRSSAFGTITRTLSFIKAPSASLARPVCGLRDERNAREAR